MKTKLSGTAATAFTALFVTTTFVLTSTVLASPVDYINPQDFSTAVEKAQENAGINTELSIDLNLDKADGLVKSEDGALELSSTSENKIEIIGKQNGGSLQIDDSALSDLTLDDGTALSDSISSDSVKYAITPFENGNVKVHSILQDKSAPETFSYTFPGVDAIILDEETGVAFLFTQNGEDFELIGGIDKPWARDAHGVAVPTHFEVEGNVLTQVVEHKSGNYAYPIVADPSWWDSIKGWFKNAGSYVTGKAKSAARWLGRNSRWLAGKTWSGVKRHGVRGGKFLAKRFVPGAVVFCAVGGGWAWYRSDASGWVRVGDAVVGCFG